MLLGKNVNADSHMSAFSSLSMPEDAVIFYLKDSGIGANWRQMAGGGLRDRLTLRLPGGGDQACLLGPGRTYIMKLLCPPTLPCCEP